MASGRSSFAESGSSSLASAEAEEDVSSVEALSFLSADVAVAADDTADCDVSEGCSVLPKHPESIAAQAIAAISFFNDELFRMLTSFL